MKRTFTVAEANSLLPLLDPLLRTAIASHQEVQEAQQEFQEINHRVFLAGGTLLNIARMIDLKARWERHGGELRRVVMEIEETGVLVKDLLQGLLDFPCNAGEETILLCWQLGEPSVAFWHTLEDGFQGRKPIDERIAGTGRKPS
jgi:hypothetical protein